AMIMPSAHAPSPFAFNHMGSGRDQSDELGVPYYN
ncbi:MAG TPA: multiple antibiotic resistance regulatory periplasmic protein MarB, partial [Escherichia sp.]|nr:multiple antibiotic resistance regulatory periplasmic protein MarB [Escherichia sp.]